MLLAMAIPTFAIDLRQGGTVTVDPGQVINDDLVMSGGTLDMRGTVNGDLVVAGGTIEVDGPVRGDLIVAGGTVLVHQPIGGSVYAAGGTVEISSTVGRNLLIAGGTVRVNAGATVARDLAATGGNVLVAGTVTRDVIARGGTFTLARMAHVGRDLTVTSSRHTVEPGAVVVGHQTFQQITRGRRHRGFGILGWIFLRFVMGLCLFVAGVVFIALGPSFTEESQVMIRTHPWATLLAGLVTLIVVPIAALILFAILIGIPLALLLVWLYASAVFISPIFIAILIGRWILRRRTGSLYLGLLIGVVIYEILRFIPFLGGLVALIVVIFGLGAIYLTWQARSAHPMYPVAAPES
jgi:hypothetical protein